MRPISTRCYTTSALTLALTFTLLGCHKPLTPVAPALEPLPLAVAATPLPTPSPSPSPTPDPTPGRIAALKDALREGSFKGHGQALDATVALLDADNPRAQKAEVIDCLVTSGAELLDDEGSWTDTEPARKIYDLLKRYDSSRVTDSLVSHVRRSARTRLHVLFLAVKLGLPGSEKRLNGVLLRHGDKQMAEDFLNSGSDALHAGGEKWSEENGYSINTGDGSHRVGWDRF